jgi:hypothetical protein
MEVEMSKGITLEEFKAEKRKKLTATMLEAKVATLVEARFVGFFAEEERLSGIPLIWSRWEELWNTFEPSGFEVRLRDLEKIPEQPLLTEGAEAPWSPNKALELDVKNAYEAINELKQEMNRRAKFWAIVSHLPIDDLKTLYEIIGEKLEVKGDWYFGI